MMPGSPYVLTNGKVAVGGYSQGMRQVRALCCRKLDRAMPASRSQKSVSALTAPSRAAARAFRGHSAMTITHVIDLAIPPSVNRLWRHSRGRTHTSAEYRIWLKNADALAMTQRINCVSSTIAGAFTAEVLVGPSRTDLDNVGSKALLDWTQSRNLIANDKHLQRLTVERVSSTEAPEGCRLTLTELGTSNADSSR